MQNRKFKIFQRALRRYTSTGIYYSVAVPLAEEFTERVMVRYEKVIATNFSLKMLRVKQDRKVYIFKRALRRYIMLDLMYSKELAKEFTERVIARWIKYAVGDDWIQRYTSDGYVEIYKKPLVSPPTNFLQEV